MNKTLLKTGRICLCSRLCGRGREQIRRGGKGEKERYEERRGETEMKEWPRWEMSGGRERGEEKAEIERGNRKKEAKNGRTSETDINVL